VNRPARSSRRCVILAIAVGDTTGYSRFMSIDERLERIAERHQALTESMELMVADSRQSDRRLSQIMNGIAQLLHVAEIRKHRIKLDGGVQ
jgi:uncharacterized protein YigA (DUF484 family)